MGHLVGKDIFRQLGKKSTAWRCATPWNAQLHAILKELYTAAEADLIVRMPSGPGLDQEVEKATGFRREELQRLLDGLTGKGLVMDLWVEEEFKYVPSPMVIGIFEFTMMQSGPQADSEAGARLFQDYLAGDGTFLAANFGAGGADLLRACLASPRGAAAGGIRRDPRLRESLRHHRGFRPLRHRALQLSPREAAPGPEALRRPLEGCSQFGIAADFMIRHNLAREVGKEEMRENFARPGNWGWC